VQHCGEIAGHRHTGGNPYASGAAGMIAHEEVALHVTSDGVQAVKGLQRDGGEIHAMVVMKELNAMVSVFHFYIRYGDDENVEMVNS
jgi:hypothetical protein